MMLLTQAIELVVADTRECTDPDLTILQAIESVREAGDDVLYGTSGMVRTAYLMVCNASDAEIERAAGLVIASL